MATRTGVPGLATATVATLMAFTQVFTEGVQSAICLDLELATRAAGEQFSGLRGAELASDGLPMRYQSTLTVSGASACAIAQTDSAARAILRCTWGVPWPAQPTPLGDDVMAGVSSCYPGVVPAVDRDARQRALRAVWRMPVAVVTVENNWAPDGSLIRSDLQVTAPTAP